MKLCEFNVKKNCSFVNYSFYKLPEKPPKENVKYCFAIYGSFCEIDMFPLSIFSIYYFNLRNLRGNRNAASDIFYRCLSLAQAQT